MRHINLIVKTIVYFTLNLRAPLEIHQDFIYVCATEETIRDIVLINQQNIDVMQCNRLDG